jgi:hypothetical protein
MMPLKYFNIGEQNLPPESKKLVRKKQKYTPKPAKNVSPMKPVCVWCHTAEKFLNIFQ